MVNEHDMWNVQLKNNTLKLENYIHIQHQIQNITSSSIQTCNCEIKYNSYENNYKENETDDNKTIYQNIWH